MQAGVKGSGSLRRWLVLAAAGTVAIMLGAGGAEAAPGDLDPSFGHGGIALSDFGNGNEDSAYALAIQKDAKIVAAGETYDGVSDDFAVARYGTGGGLNKSFGTGGVVITDLNGSSDDTAYAVAVQKDRKIVVAGESESGNARDFALARYKKNGHLDKSFGEGGVVINDLGSSSDESIYGMAIQKDGKIVVAGRSDANGNYDFAVARYLTDGSLDTSFGTGGVVLTDLGASSSDVGRAVAIQDDGMIVVAGYSDASGTSDFAVVRYDQNGNLDTAGFGTGGIVLTDIGGSGSGDAARALAIQENGYIVVAGYSDADGSFDFALVRYDEGGVPDSGFGSGGIVITDLGSLSEDTALAVALGTGGTILAGGSSNANGDFDFALARYLESGDPDTSFGTGGVVFTDLSGSNDDALRALAIQKNDKIVAAGETESDTEDFALARYAGP